MFNVVIFTILNLYIFIIFKKTLLFMKEKCASFILMTARLMLIFQYNSLLIKGTISRKSRKNSFFEH